MKPCSRYWIETQGNRGLLVIKNLPLVNNIISYLNVAKWPFG